MIGLKGCLLLLAVAATFAYCGEGIARDGHPSWGAGLYLLALVCIFGALLYGVAALIQTSERKGPRRIR